MAEGIIAGDFGIYVGASGSGCRSPWAAGGGGVDASRRHEAG